MVVLFVVVCYHKKNMNMAFGKGLGSTLKILFKKEREKTKMEKYFENMENEFINLCCYFEDKGFVLCESVDFNYSEYFLSVETYCENGMIQSHYFATKTKEETKKAVDYILSETLFSQVTVYYKNSKMIVTYRSKKDIKKYFKYYK